MQTLRRSSGVVREITLKYFDGYYNLSLAQLALQQPQDALATLAKAPRARPSDEVARICVAVLDEHGRESWTLDRSACLTLNVLLAGCPRFEQLLQTLFYQLGHLLDGMRERRAATKRVNTEFGAANGH